MRVTRKSELPSYPHASFMLTEAKIRTFKPSEKSVRLSDERGLYLEVTPRAVAGGA